jgi:hypothetical protein
MQYLLSTDYSGPNDFRHFYNELGVNDDYVCQLLDIGKPTLKRYCGDFGNPPKAMVRLLYMESHLGRRHAAIDCFNDARFYANSYTMQVQHTDTLKRKIARLEAEIQA